MRRKKDNKRVLVSPRDNRNHPKSRRRRNNRNSHKSGYGRNNHNPYQKKKKTSKLTLFLMIMALLAFVVGAGIGISLSFDSGHDDEGPHYENVTKEMTTNLNDTEPIYFEKNVDDVDFNDNITLDEFNVTNEPSY